jgi:hypothetical protein
VGSGKDAYLLQRSVWWHRVVAAEICGNPDRGGWLPLVVDQPIRAITLTRTTTVPGGVVQLPPSPQPPPAPLFGGGGTPVAPLPRQEALIIPSPNFNPVFATGAIAGSVEWRGTTVVGGMSVGFSWSKGSWKLTTTCPALDPQGIPVPPPNVPGAPQTPVDPPAPRPSAPTTPGGVGAYQTVPISSLFGQGVSLPR